MELGTLRVYMYAGERTAQNPRAHDEAQAALLYQTTSRVLSQKTAAFDAGRSWA